MNYIGATSSSITLTYYNEYGDQIDVVYDTMSPNEIRYFTPLDDGVSNSFASIKIETSSGGLIGYALKQNSGETIAYSYSMTGITNTDFNSFFLTGEDNTNELILFNPDQPIRTVDLTFYDDEGSEINLIDDLLILPYTTEKILVNDYDESHDFGSVLIESDYGLICTFGFIGEHYGFGNSIDVIIDDEFYTSFKSLKENYYPSITFSNPTSDDEDFEILMTSADGSDQDSFNDDVEPFSTVVAQPSGCYYTSNSGYDGSGDAAYSSTDCTGNIPGNPNSADSDGDGLSDFMEDLVSTTEPPYPDKNNPDIDDDGLLDGFEYYKLGGWTAVRDNGDTNPDYGADGDPDNDELTNLQEQSYGTHPKNSDTDNDGVDDLYEYVIYEAAKFLKEMQDIDSLQNVETPSRTVNFDDGEFPAYEWKQSKKDDPHNTFNCNFQTMFILHSLTHLDDLSTLDTKLVNKLDGIISKSVTNLKDIKLNDPNQASPTGGKVWDFYGGDSGMLRDYKESDPDLDDTFNALQVLYENDVDIDNYYPTAYPPPEYLDKFLKGTNPLKNKFYSFIRNPMPGLNDVDSVVNANALWFYTSQGKESLVPDIDEYLDTTVNTLFNSNGAQFGSTFYYECCPYSYVYSITRAYAEGADILDGNLDKDLKEFLINGLTRNGQPKNNMKQQQDGSWNPLPTNVGSHSSNTFETTLATISLMYLKDGIWNDLTSTEQNELDTAIDDGIDYIMDQFNQHYGDDDDPDNIVPWPWGTFFLNPSGEQAGCVVYMGSDSMTTAFVLEALSLYLS